MQAQDRAYRIGQSRDVEVFRLISAGTIEEIVYARQIYKQQQANIGYNASNERRYFKGVQQDKDRKGELFGLKNLFTFHADQVVLQGILNQTNIAEAKVGAQLAEVDMSQVEVDDDDTFPSVKKEEGDDNGLSQLAAFIKMENPEEEKSKKKPGRSKNDGAIQAILASVGVQYTHENSEVVGSSKVEAQLSRRAELAADLDLLDGNEDQSALFHDGDQLHTTPVNVSRFTPRFNPPQEVMQRQFCSMAAEFGYVSVTDFALAVEQMTQEERRDTLDSFYRKRMATLLKEELERGKDTDESKVGVLKAEVDAFDNQKVKTWDDDDVRIKVEASEHEVDTRLEGKLESFSPKKIKVEPKEESGITKKADGKTSIGNFNGIGSMRSIFIYDDDDDEGEL